MSQLFSNGGRGELASTINSTDTIITIVAGGASFPVANTGAVAISAVSDWFKCVLQDATGIEIVYVRTHTAASLSFSDVLRGQEGTTARGFTAAVTVFGMRVTAADMAAVSSKVSLTGVETLTNKTLTSPDINGGTIDGAVIGGSAAAAGSFTTLSASGNVTLGDISSDVVTVTGNLSVGGSTTNLSGNLNIPINSQINFNGGLDQNSRLSADSVFGTMVYKGYNGHSFKSMNGGEVERLKIDSAGAVTIPGTLSLTGASSTLGYGTGAGGTVNQATSKSTGVTLNKPCGQITMYGVNDSNGQLAAGAIVSFVLSNYLVVPRDLVSLGLDDTSPGGSSGKYQVWSSSASGGLRIYVQNVSTGPLSEALVINFAVIKGVIL